MEKLEHALSQIVQQSFIEIYIIARDASFIYANDAALKNIGYSLEELCRITPVEITANYSQQELQHLTRPLDEHEPGKIILSFSNVHIRKNGSTYPVETHLQKIMCEDEALYVATIQDVTDKRRLLDQLNLVIQAGEFGFWDRNLATDEYEISDKSLSILGYTREDLGADITDWLNLIHPEDLLGIIRNAEHYGKQDESWTAEYRMKHKDGTWRWIRGTSKVVARNPLTGEPVRMCGTHLDFTNEKLMEAEQQKAQKLEGLGVLAGGIAHDFNNILTILFGNISLARTQQEQGKSSIATLMNAEQAFHRATHLTSQLLTFAKGGEPVRQNISIADLIEEVIKFDLSGSNIKAVFNHAGDLWMADVDRGLVAQVFSNLTTNANQAMPKGGHLYISAENYLAEIGNSLELRPGPYLRFSVRDEGSGIDSSVINKIFDPYFTTKKAGTGLGLATVYSIVQKHGGRIQVFSQRGEGAEFIFYLPASPETRIEAATHRNEFSRTYGSRGRVLIVDDEKLICALATDILEESDYQVSCSYEVGHALSLYRNAMLEMQPYDCVIIDLTIPGGKGGLDLLRDLQELDPGVNAIVTSGYSSDPVMANYRDYGFSGFLTKPFTQVALCETVMHVLQISHS